MDGSTDISSKLHPDAFDPIKSWRKLCIIDDSIIRHMSRLLA